VRPKVELDDGWITLYGGIIKVFITTSEVPPKRNMTKCRGERMETHEVLKVFLRPAGKKLTETTFS